MLLSLPGPMFRGSLAHAIALAVRATRLPVDPMAVDPIHHSRPWRQPLRLWSAPLEAAPPAAVARKNRSPLVHVAPGARVRVRHVVEPVPSR